MTKQRLNKSIREDLYAFATSSVKSPETEDAANDALKRAIDAVNLVINRRYPRADIEVLKRYNLARQPDYVAVANPEGSMSHFEIGPDTSVEPVKVSDYVDDIDGYTQYNHKASTYEMLPYMFGGLNHIPVAKRGNPALAVDDDVFELIAASVRTKNAHAEALNKKLDMYRQLIAGARYCEDVVEAWPAAAKVMPDGPKGGALTISAEAIAAIKADNAGA